MVLRAFGTGSVRCQARALVFGVLLVVVVVAAGCGVAIGGRGEGGDPSSPSPLASRAAVVVGPRLSGGGEATCVVRPTGQLVCWGANAFAELGAGVRAPYLEPVEAAGFGSGVLGVSTGGAHTCAITSGGGVQCWGSNGYGQLGDGTTLDSVVPVEVIGLGAGVAAISVGGEHTCALTGAGGVRCWGLNANGQLGDGTRIDRATPVEVTGLSAGVAALSAGVRHTCAVTTSGALKCWGDNFAGQLGDGMIPIDEQSFIEEGQGPDLADGSRVSPTDVVGLGSGVAAVSAGYHHTCAVTTAGGVKCWGDSQWGALGVGLPPRYDIEGRLLAGVGSSGVPLDVVGLASPMVGVTVGSIGYTCAWSAVGDVSCWGSNMSGQLGQGSVPEMDGYGVVRSGIAESGVPLPVVNLGMRAIAVGAGSRHACALSAEGEVRCWGANGSGELGGVESATLASGVPVGVRWPSSLTSTPKVVDLNLIVVNSDADLTSDLDPIQQANQAAIAERLIARDPTLLEAIRVGIRGATWGRLDPQVQVSVTTTPVKAPWNCGPASVTPQLIEETAKPQRVEGAINVVVARLRLCGDDESPLGGYDNPEGMPVVGWSAMTSVAELVHVIVHEYGHDSGLKHAGVVSCEDPVTLTGCDLSQTDDGTSVMSYASTDTLTVPELHQLGLLTKDEVATAARDAGTEEFRLADRTRDGTKLVVVHLRNQEDVDTVYLSARSGSVEVRLDPDATTRQFDLEHSVNGGCLAVVSRNTAPRPGEVLLRRLGVTITYQGLDADAKPVIKVTRET